jgi:protease-4
MAAENSWDNSNESTIKENTLVQKLLLASQAEQRRARRWGIFFKLLIFFYLFLLLAIYYNSDWQTNAAKTGPHTAIIDIQGAIAADTEANANAINRALHNAFENENTRGIILAINSPGGSPVQSDQVYNEIQRLRSHYANRNIKVYSVISDMGASGAYYIASGADEIYANPSSLVGSIGVIMSGFGFVDAIEKLGISRRLNTAGKNKGFLDPFSPVVKSQEKHLQDMLDGIHQQFISKVKKGRGKRLQDNPELFSGLVWTGEEARKLGLIDGFGSVQDVAREVIGVSQLVDYTQRPNPLTRFAERFGAQIGQGLASALGLQQANLH